MKITKAQLKELIVEQVKKSLIKESVDGGRLLMGIGAGGAAFQTGVDDCKAEWLGMYSDEDPSMAAAGRDGWARQVEMACLDLEDGITTLFNDIDDKLFSGDYDYRK